MQRLQKWLIRAFMQAAISLVAGMIVKHLNKRGNMKKAKRSPWRRLLLTITFLGLFPWPQPVMAGQAHPPRSLPPTSQAVLTKGKSPATDSGSTTIPSTYLDTLNVRPAWAKGFQGNGIGVAVIDSGITPTADFGRIAAAVAFNPTASTTDDLYGHGTHVAGIIAGNGALSNGLYQGVAPGVHLINLKVGDDRGVANEAEVVAALQWVLEHKAEYNIRVVNLSVNVTETQSYHTSALDAAVEILWFNGVVVVAATGNKDASNGFNPVMAAPANDPFIITVGASDEKGDSTRKNDNIARFTAYDQTGDGFVKPDLMAPGVEIISLLAPTSNWGLSNPERVIGNGAYFRLSGASMATPMVTGAVALLLQAEPQLTPDQVKYRLLATAGKVGKAKYLDVQAMLNQMTTASANGGVTASQLLWQNGQPLVWNNVNWNTVNWNTVMWKTVMWKTVMWKSVSWE